MSKHTQTVYYIKATSECHASLYNTVTPHMVILLTTPFTAPEGHFNGIVITHFPRLQKNIMRNGN